LFPILFGLPFDRRPYVCLTCSCALFLRSLRSTPSFFTLLAQIILCGRRPATAVDVPDEFSSLNTSFPAPNFAFFSTPKDLYVLGIVRYMLPCSDVFPPPSLLNKAILSVFLAFEAQRAAPLIRGASFCFFFSAARDCQSFFNGRLCFCFLNRLSSCGFWFPSVSSKP